MAQTFDMSLCLPIMLLSSIPLALQSEVSDPSFSNLAEEQRPASNSFRPDAIVDSQPPKGRVPMYRRFSNFKPMAPPSPDSSIPSHDSRTPLPRSSRAERTRSMPVGLELTTSYGLQTNDQQMETEGRKARKSLSEAGAFPSTKNEFAEDKDLNGFDFAISQARNHPKTSSIQPFSSSGPSRPAPALRSSSYTQKPRRLSNLQTLVENEAMTSSQQPVISRELPSLSIHTAELPLYSGSGHDYSSSTPSRLASKRVSFSSSADEVIDCPEPTLEQSSPARRHSSWSGFLLMTTGVVPRPPLSRQSSLPSTRGPAAGRSILKRSNSLSERPAHEPSHSSIGVAI